MLNNDPQIITPVTHEEMVAKKTALGIYILYVLGFWAVLPAVIGIIIAYVFETDKSELLRSHYNYIIRTFWIGALYFFIAYITHLILIGFILFPLTIIWWLIRSIKGFKLLAYNSPIANSKAWLI